MSLNLSRNAVAMERALGFLADAERALEDCSSCLARDVIVAEAQAAEHNRSIVSATWMPVGTYKQLSHLVNG